MHFCALDNIRAIESVKTRRKAFQLLQRRVEQTDRPRKRAALHVVIRGGELDQSLVEENEVIVFGFEPKLFPCFVSVPELALVEEPDSVVEAQSVARVPLRSVSHIAPVKSELLPVPPMSRVRCSGPLPRTTVMASCTRLAGPLSPMW